MSNGFIVYSPLTTKSVEDFTANTEENERILLEGIASTTNKDLYGEIISPDAMKKMVEQISICKNCGNIIYYNEFLNGYYCEKCNNLEVININGFK